MLNHSFDIRAVVSETPASAAGAWLVLIAPLTFHTQSPGSGALNIPVCCLWNGTETLGAAMREMLQGEAERRGFHTNPPAGPASAGTRLLKREAKPEDGVWKWNILRGYQ